MEKAHAHAHTASQPFRVPPTSTGASASGGLALPFRFSVARAQAMTVRNVPYLRHSWSRLDCVALVGFWVAFALAQAGAERGPGGAHVGLFRALSVLRLARLLAITSGTTVRRALFFFLEGRALIDRGFGGQTIMRSLKIARPLLTSVLYFVLFAMALFS